MPPKIESEVELATKEIPLYRLPHGIKQELLEKINAIGDKSIFCFSLLEDPTYTLIISRK